MNRPRRVVWYGLPPYGGSEMREMMLMRIRNTEDEARQNPENVLMEAIIEGVDGLIDRQEARGQEELCASTQLPTQGVDDTTLEKMGIVIGPASDDPMFRFVTLPEGWSIQPTGPPYWSTLVDARGNPRVAIFYKAAFYDRSAHMRLNNRYIARSHYPEMEHYMAVVEDARTGKFIFSTEVSVRPSDDDDEMTKAWYATMDPLIEEAKVWLRENYPNHADPHAYWDDE